MNESELQRLLQEADRAAPPVQAVADGFASRVRSARRRQIVRRRVAASCGTALLITGIALGSFHLRHRRQNVASVPHVNVAIATAAMDLDRDIARSEALVARLRAGQRLGELRSRLAAVRDPLAAADERAAQSILAEADNPKAIVPGSSVRRELLATLVRLYPQTTTAVIARRELNNPKDSELDKNL